MSGLEISANAPSKTTTSKTSKTNDLAKKFELGKPTFKGTREQNIEKMARSWKLAYPQANEGDLKRFIRKLYKVCKQLKITQTNDGKLDPRYATKEDQIVDEMLAVFANESELNPNKIKKSPKDTYRGVFQLGDKTFAEMKKHNPATRPFGKTLEQQLDNLVDYFKYNHDIFGMPDGLRLNAKRAATMIKFPKAWHYNETVGGKKSQDWWELKNRVCQQKIAERDRKYADDQRMRYRKAKNGGN